MSKEVAINRSVDVYDLIKLKKKEEKVSDDKMFDSKVMPNGLAIICRNVGGSNRSDS